MNAEGELMGMGIHVEGGLGGREGGTLDADGVG